MKPSPCPRCGTEIAEAGRSDGEEGPIPSPEPAKEYATCPGCGAELERQPEAERPLEHLRAWYPAGEAPEPPDV